MHPGILTIIMMCVDVILIIGVMLEGVIEPRKGNRILATAIIVTFIAMLVDSWLY